MIAGCFIFPFSPLREGEGVVLLHGVGGGEGYIGDIAKSKLGWW